MKKIIFILIICNFLYAQVEFEDDFSDFLAKETEIATKTKINIDFVPGMVSVLKREELLKLGVDNIYEAFALIPGVDYKNNFLQEPTIRGINNEYSSGKIKVMINSTSFNNSFNGLGLLPYIPIELIDRIEVIRGAGSAIYGEYAYSAVINIILREDKKNGVFYKYSRYSKDNGGDKVGGYFSYSQNDFNINLNLFKDKSDEFELYVRDRYGVSQPELIRNEYGVSSTLNYKNFSLKLMRFQKRDGDGFGVSVGIPKYDGAMNSFFDTYLLELNQKFEFNDLTLSLKAGEFKLKKFAITKHDAFADGEPKVGIFETGQTLQDDYFNTELKYVGFNNHKLLVGLDIKRARQTNSEGKLNFTFSQPIIYFDKPIPFSMTNRNGKRDISAIYFQDEFKLNKSIDIIVGVRGDKYSDVKTSINPRLAGVYEFNAENIFKMQYARAFRPPTFAELYFFFAPLNQEIEAETIDSYEVSHIYNDNSFNLKTTLFFLKLNHLITADFIKGYYINKNRVTSKGFEIEAKYNYKDEWLLATNLSYANSKDDTTKKELNGVANLLGNLSLIFNPHGKYQMGFLYNYIGKKDRVYESGETSPNHTLDTTFTLKRVFNSLDVQVGIKNIFDDEVLYPANQLHLVGDYPTNARTYFFTLKSEF